jgi:hypothetical protein
LSGNFVKPGHTVQPDSNNTLNVSRATLGAPSLWSAPSAPVSGELDSAELISKICGRESASRASVSYSAYSPEIDPEMADAALRSAEVRHGKVFSSFQNSLKNDPPFFERLLHRFYTEVLRVRPKTNSNAARQTENLMGDLAPLVPLFDTKSVTNVYVYGDGRVQADDFEKGVYDTGTVLSPAERTRIINSIASVSETPVDRRERPTLESVIPGYNIRTTAIAPPWTEYPEITFHRPAEKVYTLDEYRDRGRPEELYGKIVGHIENRSNIVVSGSTGSGKTTFTNACIEKMREFIPDERFYIIEDTPELQCRSPSKTQLYIRKDQAAAVTRIEGLLRQKIAGQIPDLADTVQLAVHFAFRRGFGPVVGEALTLPEIKEARMK